MVHGPLLRVVRLLKRDFDRPDHVLIPLPYWTRTLSPSDSLIRSRNRLSRRTLTRTANSLIREILLVKRTVITPEGNKSPSFTTPPAASIAFRKLAKRFNFTRPGFRTHPLTETLIIRCSSAI